MHSLCPSRRERAEKNPTKRVSTPQLDPRWSRRLNAGHEQQPVPPTSCPSLRRQFTEMGSSDTLLHLYVEGLCPLKRIVSVEDGCRFDEFCDHSHGDWQHIFPARVGLSGARNCWENCLTHLVSAYRLMSRPFVKTCPYPAVSRTLQVGCSSLGRDLDTIEVGGSNPLIPTASSPKQRSWITTLK